MGRLDRIPRGSRHVHLDRYGIQCIWGEPALERRDADVPGLRGSTRRSHALQHRDTWPNARSFLAATGGRWCGRRLLAARQRCVRGLGANNRAFTDRHGGAWHVQCARRRHESMRHRPAHAAADGDCATRVSGVKRRPRVPDCNRAAARQSFAWVRVASERQQSLMRSNSVDRVQDRRRMFLRVINCRRLSRMVHNRLGPVLGLALVVVIAGAGATQSPPVTWRSEGPFLASSTDVAIDALHPDTVYLSTLNGGVYRSDDGGRSWQLPGNEMTSRNVEWVEVDPANPSTVWAGDDDPANPTMWRSTDRGATWELVTDSYKGERTRSRSGRPSHRVCALETPRHLGAVRQAQFSESRRRKDMDRLRRARACCKSNRRPPKKC